MTEERVLSESEPTHTARRFCWRRYVPLLLVLGGIIVFSAGFWRVAIGSVGVIFAGSESAFASAALLGVPVMLAGLAIVAAGDMVDRVSRH